MGKRVASLVLNKMPPQTVSVHIYAKQRNPISNHARLRITSWWCAIRYLWTWPIKHSIVCIYTHHMTRLTLRVCTPTPFPPPIGYGPRHSCCCHKQCEHVQHVVRACILYIYIMMAHDYRRQLPAIQFPASIVGAPRRIWHRGPHHHMCIYVIDNYISTHAGVDHIWLILLLHREHKALPISNMRNEGTYYDIWNTPVSAYMCTILYNYKSDDFDDDLLMRKLDSYLYIYIKCNLGTRQAGYAYKLV